MKYAIRDFRWPEGMAMHRHRRLLLRAGARRTDRGGRPDRRPGSGQAPGHPIVARKFTYEPAEITLKLNEPVVFQLTTQDVVMGFSVPDFEVRATIIPGQTVELPMTPTKTGEFRFSATCSAARDTKTWRDAPRNRMTTRRDERPSAFDDRRHRRLESAGAPPSP